MPFSVSKSISAVGVTDPIKIQPSSATTRGVISHQIGIIVNLTSGASLSYSVEVTGDDVYASKYAPANGVWTAVADLANLTASSTGFLAGLVMGVRLNVSSYSSGTATLQVIQND